jgi:hypothetical protein
MQRIIVEELQRTHKLTSYKFCNKNHKLISNNNDFNQVEDMITIMNTLESKNIDYKIDEEYNFIFSFSN